MGQSTWGYTLPFSFAQQRTKPIMNPLILLTACVAASQAQYIAAPYGLGAPLTYGAAPIAYQTAAAPAPVVTVNAAPAPVVAAAPLNPSSQFQAQDEFGNIQYGYSNINSQKHETGNTYGGVSGSYSLVQGRSLVCAFCTLPFNGVLVMGPFRGSAEVMVWAGRRISALPWLHFTSFFSVSHISFQ